MPPRTGSCSSRLRPYLRAIAVRHHRERSDVEDSIQDILLTVHVVRHTYDPTRPFKPWLAAIARRRIIDRLRGQGRRRARETFLSPEHETFSAPEANLYEAEPDMRALRDAVAQLPEGQRHAVTMLKIEEKSLKPRRRPRWGCPSPRWKVSMHWAMKNLRKIMDRRSAGHVNTTQDLIESLAADAKPVRRLRPPVARATAWLAAFVAVVGVVTFATGAWPAMIVRLEELCALPSKMAATFVTALAAR